MKGFYLHPVLTNITNTDSLPVRSVLSTVSLPLRFDGREHWGPLVTPIIDQGKCGACWAFSTVAALSDRFNILSAGKIFVNLSATKMLLCNLGKREYELDTSDQSLAQIEQVQQENAARLVCHGNTLQDAWRYLHVIGTPTEACFPYELDSHVKGTTLAQLSDTERNVPLCAKYAGKYADLCIDGSPQRSYRAIQYYHVPGPEENLRRELYVNGPFTAAMRMYPDFYQFDPKRQVYTHPQKEEAQLSGHAVRVVGWGATRAEGKFWLVANTFGPEWGLGGYFKMRRGENTCGIEENVIVGLPDFFGTHLFDQAQTLSDDLRDRLMYESPNGTGGGLDPKTGYLRYYYSLWPELRTPMQRLDVAQIAATVTWAAVWETFEKHQLFTVRSGRCWTRAVLATLLVVLTIAVGTLANVWFIRKSAVLVP